MTGLVVKAVVPSPSQPHPSPPTSCRHNSSLKGKGIPRPRIAHPRLSESTHEVERATASGETNSGSISHHLGAAGSGCGRTMFDVRQHGKPRWLRVTQTSDWPAANPRPAPTTSNVVGIQPRQAGKAVPLCPRTAISREFAVEGVPDHLMPQWLQWRAKVGEPQP